MNRLSRRTFVARASAAGALAATLSARFASAQPAQPASAKKPRPAIDKSAVPDKGPRLDPDLVFQFVYFAHTNLEVVTDMLEENPALVNAAWDWGGGDWETALGAASHMGRRDIAEHLLAHSARLDIFAATMLGDLDTVKAALTAHPFLLKTPGPHGISLIKHAEKGGDPAKPVLDFLTSLKPKGD